MIHSRSFAELSTRELYAILRLRSEVFVVEQSCAYGDMDGRDLEVGSRHWFYRSSSKSSQGQGPIDAYLRTLDNGESWAIGRVVTAVRARRRGLAASLIERALCGEGRACTLNAQTHLESWYGRFGFVRTGEDFDEDGILHLPMRRSSTQ